MASEDKRILIMQAAEKLFTSRRFHEITTDDIARQAKVGKGTIYRYFQDKDDLFFQTAMSGFEEMCDLLRKGVSEDGDFRRQLLEAARQISGFFARRRQLFRMMQAAEAPVLWHNNDMRQRWLANRERLVSAIGEIIARGVTQGHIRKDIPPAILGQYLLGMLRTRARDLQDAPAPYQSLETAVDLFLVGSFDHVAQENSNKK
jgi:TetR/AcrR family transcriptional regulator, fatty acid metabolism regulator protein